MSGKRMAQFFCLVLMALFLIGCGGKPTPTAPPTPLTNTPTTVPDRTAELSAERAKVQFRYPGQTAKEVRVGQSESVGTGDQINTDSYGVGILKFSAFLRVKIFRKTGLQVEAAPDPSASPIVKLYLALGTTRQELQRRAGQAVDVTTKTGWATIRAKGTAYLVSVDDDEVTWVVVFDGEVEVEAQGQTVVVRAGQATWVEPGQAPHSPIDVDIDEVERWLERLGGTGDVGPIRPVIQPSEEEDGTNPWLEVGRWPEEVDGTQEVTVGVEAGDDESGLDRIEIQMPGQRLVTCRGSSCEATGGPYSAGEYGYEVAAFDNAGNVTHQEGSFTVVSREAEDQTDPWLEVGHWPEEMDETQEVTVSVEAGDDESGLDRIEIQMPGQRLVTCKDSSCEATGGPYSAGEYGYEVAAFDRAGNVAYRKGYFAVAATVVQDNPPVVEGVYVEPSTIYQEEQFRITLVASDDIGLESIWWQMKGTGDDYFDSGDEADCGGITWCELSWSLEWTGREGEFPVYARARDTAGQLSNVESTTITVLAPSATARFSLSIGGGPFYDESVQKALGFGIDWAALRDGIGEVVLVDFLSGKTVAGPTEPAYSLDRAKEILADTEYYYGFGMVLMFDSGDELTAELAKWVASYLGDLGIDPEFLWIDPADARAKLAAMIEAGESGLLLERR